MQQFREATFYQILPPCELLKLQNSRQKRQKRKLCEWHLLSSTNIESYDFSEAHFPSNVFEDLQLSKFCHDFTCPQYFQDGV